MLRAQATRAAAAGNSTLARRLRSQSVRPLIALARHSEAYRDAVYAAIYESLEPDQDPTAMHPFERCALVAGLLADAQSTIPEQDSVRAVPAADRARLLDRAIRIADGLLADPGSLDRSLRAEVFYNLGVARYRRGQRLEAARAFLSAGRDFPNFPLAERATILAVQAAWEVGQEPGLKNRPDLRDLYLEALTVLTDQYPRSSAAAYWRFFRAQALQEIGRL
ncbi:MAG: tetratricopeptide repeat protein, partial [Planctomycetota bacterium]